MTKQNHAWASPTLVVYGSIDELTARQKALGADDGFTLEGNSIGDANPFS